MQRWHRATSRGRVTRAGKAILLAGAIITTGCKPASFHGTVYDPPQHAPDVVLQEASGARFSLAEQQGKVVLLFFGYTHCPDICPTTLSDWKRIKAQLGRDTTRVRFVFISVDPARDDPATLERYVAEFDPGFIGATADSARIASIEHAFHVSSSREVSTSAKPSANGYAVSHASQTFVVDKFGDLRLLYGFGMPTDEVVSDIRLLLKGA